MVRSNVSRSASASVSRTASGWSAKRLAIAWGVLITWLWLPRRNGSQASSVAWWRERHERVLQLGPGARVRVDVAGGHASDSQPPGERGQRAVAGAIVAGVRALQLHVQALRAERVEQPPGRALVVDAATDHRSAGTARQADEALGVVDHRLHVHRRLGVLAPRRCSRGCAAWASVMIRQRLLQPRSSRTSSVM